MGGKQSVEEDQNMPDFEPVKFSHNEFKPADGCKEDLSPVIFLHGITGQKENWTEIPQIVADKTGRKTYAYDARNHGESDYSDTFCFDTNVDDLFHFMDSINEEKAILVGHSMGGITAIKAALRNPKRIKMIVIEDMHCSKMSKEVFQHIFGATNGFIDSVAAIPSEVEPEEAFQYAVEMIYNATPDDSKHLFKKDTLINAGYSLCRKDDGCYDVKFNKDAILSTVKNSDGLDRKLSGKFEQPAYFLYGADSPFCVGKEASTILKHFPNAELIEIEGAGHNVHFENFDKFVETVLKKMKKNTC